MNTTASTTHATPALPADAPASAKRVFRLLNKLQHGRLDIEWPDGGHSRFPASAIGHDDTPGVRATLCLTNSKQSQLAREASISMITSGNRFFGEDYNTYSRLSQLAVVDILYAGLIVLRGQQHQDKLDSRSRTAKA